MSASYHSNEQLIHALKWQLDMGIDSALVDSPAELNEPVRPPTPPAPAIIARPAPAIIAEPSAPSFTAPAARRQQTNITTDETLAALASLDDLKAALQGFDGCALKQTASTLVFADGNPQADIMLIGEAPGRDEDRMGLPFIGAAGQLLDKMLSSVGLDRQSVYITNILPWRPPGNRTPSVEETQMLWPFLKRHIQIKNPGIILALGGSAAKLLLDSQTGILKLRGQMTQRNFGNSEEESLMIPVLPSLHPAYLLRAPNMKALAFSDLLMLKRFIEAS